MRSMWQNLWQTIKGFVPTLLHWPKDCPFCRACCSCMRIRTKAVPGASTSERAWHDVRGRMRMLQADQLGVTQTNRVSSTASFAVAELRRMTARLWVYCTVYSSTVYAAGQIEFHMESPRQWLFSSFGLLESLGSLSSAACPMSLKHHSRSGWCWSRTTCFLGETRKGWRSTRWICQQLSAWAFLRHRNMSVLQFGVATGRSDASCSLRWECGLGGSGLRFSVATQPLAGLIGTRN